MRNQKLTVIFLILISVNSILIPFKAIASKKAIAKGKSLSIYSVKQESQKGIADCFNYYGDCIVLGENEPLLLIKDFVYEIIDTEKPGFIIYLSTEEHEKLYTISKTLIGKKMALVIDKNVLHIGKVKRIIDSDSFQVTFCNVGNYKTVLSYFTGELKTLPNDIKCGC